MKKTLMYAYVSFLVLLVPPSSLTPAPAAQKKSPTTYNVAIKDFKFQPANLEVEVNDTVVWTNADIVPHIVIAEKFRSKSIDKGESWSLRVKQKGDFPYTCRFHPTMKAELIVH